MCRLTQLGGSPKETVKSYIPVNYLSGRNVALLSMCSVWRGMEVERTAAPTEARIRI